VKIETQTSKRRTESFIGRTTDFLLDGEAQAHGEQDKRSSNTETNAGNS
jgi:hypothetical protein